MATHTFNDGAADGNWGTAGNWNGGQKQVSGGEVAGGVLI